MLTARDTDKTSTLPGPLNVLVVRARSLNGGPEPGYYEPLRAAGFNLLTMHDYAEALRMAARALPRFVILDFTRPDPALLELLETWKEDHCEKVFPLLLVGRPPGTGYADGPRLEGLVGQSDRAWEYWRIV